MVVIILTVLMAYVLYEVVWLLLWLCLVEDGKIETEEEVLEKWKEIIKGCKKDLEKLW